MKKHTIIAIIVVIVGILGIVVFRLILPSLEEQFTYGTSDAKNLKGEFTIALDSWIGYFPFQSAVFKKLVREQGYKVIIIDDEANYPLRMERLKKGEIDFAVCTIDSYLINGAPEDFPGTIIVVIDESKGGDAMVAWKSKIDNLDKLKTATDYRVAFTPASPSEHLLKAIGVHFGIPQLLDKKGSWRIETVGAEQAYKELMKKNADIAVIWEPHVTESLSNPEIVKLLGTEDTEKLIIDILLVNRTYSRNNPDICRLVAEKYFETLTVYQNDPPLLEEDIVDHTKLKRDKVASMLKGVRWIGLKENTRWFGLDKTSTAYREELSASIDSTVRILIENDDFPANPLTNEDPYTIINSSFMENIYIAGIPSDTSDSDDATSLEHTFSPLTDDQWKKLKVVGTLKVRPITFRSSTAELDEMGEMQLDIIIENIKHYPNFRIMVKGHTDPRGDETANLKLSEERAEAVKEYMVHYYSIDPNRIRSVGVGSAEPLSRNDGESSRSYSDRLKRVEIYLVAAQF
jgi:outer membrane protein OmpA-like peptidoglycan-associated protein/ABC-type nitrate/sulfonate/bicarbonate transport system substrate-binding protein